MAHEIGFSPAYFAQFVGAGEKHSKAVHLLEKSVINMIRLLLPVFDWFGPGGLLLVVPHVFAVPVSVLRADLQNFK